MFRGVRAIAVAAGVLLAAIAIGAPALAQPPAGLTILAAGTLAGPFRALDTAFQQQYPNVAVRPIFAGSVALARRIADLHQRTDIFATADFRVIPKYLFGAGGKERYADWHAWFARNAIIFTYTDQSKFARQITPRNWYEVLARPGVETGRANPDTDPSGCLTLLMLQLAERCYHVPDLDQKLLAHSPQRNMRDTETDLIPALQLGEIDYLAIYRSDAVQHHLDYLALPAEINLSAPKPAKPYASAVAHTTNGDIPGVPIVYAVTIPKNAPQADWAQKYVALLLGPVGQKIMRESGFEPLGPADAVPLDKVPPSLRPLVTAWLSF